MPISLILLVTTIRLSMKDAVVKVVTFLKFWMTLNAIKNLSTKTLMKISMTTKRNRKRSEALWSKFRIINWESLQDQVFRVPRWNKSLKSNITFLVINKRFKKAIMRQKVEAKEIQQITSKNCNTTKSISCHILRKDHLKSMKTTKQLSRLQHNSIWFQHTKHLKELINWLRNKLPSYCSTLTLWAKTRVAADFCKTLL